MNILVVYQHYDPEPFRVSDLCEELARRGHQVTVVTGEPNYPEGEIYPGYEHHQRADEVIRGVRVHRCPIIPRKTGTLFRVLNYYSYPISAKRYLKKLLRRMDRPFDVVFANQTSPVMMARPAMWYRKKTKTPVLLYCMDLWPESLAAGGVRRGSMVYRLFHRVSGRIYGQADRILVSSRMFTDYLHREFGIPYSRMGYLPQYAEALFEKLPCREKDGETRLLFAGNIGALQSVDTILAAAELLRDQPVRFWIAGGGSDLERIEGIARDKALRNVEFLGRRPLEEMPGLYRQSDALLVTLRADPVLSLTLPGKVQSYMAAGKPIIGAIDGEAAQVIAAAKCGYCGPADDAKALADNIRAFIRADNAQALGDNARAYYDQFFERNTFMDRLERELKDL